MRANARLNGHPAYFDFLLMAGRNNKIIAIDDISVRIGKCDAIDAAFPPNYGPSVCSVDDSTDVGKI